MRIELARTCVLLACALMWGYAAHGAAPTNELLVDTIEAQVVELQRRDGVISKQLALLRSVATKENIRIQALERRVKQLEGKK